MEHSNTLILWRANNDDDRWEATPLQIAQWWHEQHPENPLPTRREVFDWIRDPDGLDSMTNTSFPSQRTAFDHVLGAINRLARERADVPDQPTTLIGGDSDGS